MDPNAGEKAPTNARNRRRARRRKIAIVVARWRKELASKPKRRALRNAVKLARAVFHRREMPQRFSDPRLAAAYAAELEGLRRREVRR